MRMLPDKPTYPAASTSATSHCHSDGVIALPIEQQDQKYQVNDFLAFSILIFILVVLANSVLLEDKGVLS